MTHHLFMTLSVCGSHQCATGVEGQVQNTAFFLSSGAAVWQCLQDPPYIVILVLVDIEFESQGIIGDRTFDDFPSMDVYPAPFLRGHQAQRWSSWYTHL